MAEDSETKRWNTITGVALAIAIVISVAVAFVYGIINGVFTLLILTGLFLAIEFYLRDSSRKSGGPSTADGIIMGGVLLAGIGACGFIYTFTNDVMVTSICIIAVMFVAAGVMIMRNRSYL